MFITHGTQEIFILVFIRYLFFNFQKFFCSQLCNTCNTA